MPSYVVFKRFMSQEVISQNVLSQKTSCCIIAAACGLASTNSLAQESTAHKVEEIEVVGRRVNLVGNATSASEGLVSHQELEIRPLLRVGEVLETVPGMVTTQHSGSGKANQYFLRGFNLDHGNDFATSVDKMPVNMRTHGHGQGYTDLNFIIPEMIEEIAYQKGSYYAGAGEFSGTGSAEIRSLEHTQGNRITLGLGQDNYQRLLGLGELEVGNGELLYGLELEGYDGPWEDLKGDVEKKNIWLKQQWQSGVDSFSLTFMGYDNSWNSADQIPLRAVEQGLISEFGSIDPSSGGESSRYSLSGAWKREGESTELNASVYVIDYEMALWGNFTYFMGDPVNGDQFEQVDDRRIYGWDLAYSIDDNWAGFEARNTFGSQMRYDDIDEVGIFSSRARQRTGVFRTDAVKEWSTGLYWENTLQWTEQFRTVFGLRYDYFDFEVDPLLAADPSTLAVNGGSADDDVVTASLSGIYTLSESYELYASIGQGFHSNDARGTTIQFDPISGDPAAKVDALVDTLGYELGLRAFINDKLNASVALWSLGIDSELVFVGDAGGTEDTGVGSDRQGLEVTAYYYIDDQWTLDFEYAYSDAQFEHRVDGSREIPGALEHVFSAGINSKFSDQLNANLRLRYFGDYPLDGGLRADSSFIMNARVAYDFNENFAVSLDVLNLLDSNDHDIDYAYESQLPGEADPVQDIHFHIFEPRTFRVYASYRF